MTGASNYPISKLLFQIISETAVSEADFIINSLSYRDGERGLRRLRLWTEAGEGHQRIINQIAQATGRGEELQKAIADTREVKREQYEAAFLETCRGEATTFRPFLCAIGSQSVPEGICIFGMMGGHLKWTKLEIPQSLLDLSGDGLFLALLPYMNEYKQKHNGSVPFFGGLTGFRFVRLIDNYQFTADGKLTAHINKPYRLGTCSVRLE